MFKKLIIVFFLASNLHFQTANASFDGHDNITVNVDVMRALEIHLGNDESSHTDDMISEQEANNWFFKQNLSISGAENTQVKLKVENLGHFKVLFEKGCDQTQKIEEGSQGITCLLIFTLENADSGSFDQEINLTAINEGFADDEILGGTNPK
jgi:hypothetical protein